MPAKIPIKATPVPYGSAWNSDNTETDTNQPIEFDSFNQAALNLGVPLSTIQRWCRKGVGGGYYWSRPLSKPAHRPVACYLKDNGKKIAEFSSVRQAAESLGVTECSISRSLSEKSQTRTTTTRIPIQALTGHYIPARLEVTFRYR